MEDKEGACEAESVFMDARQSGCTGMIKHLLSIYKYLAGCFDIYATLKWANLLVHHAVKWSLCCCQPVNWVNIVFQIINFLQVLSQSVANALRMKHDEQLSSTIELIEKINDVFDMLNVRYAKEGQRSNNKNRRPYESTTDDRFKVHCALLFS